MEYTIRSFPTVYKGRQYRSRLEARWAAFFDLLGWNAEYEPFDLGSWSPDFLLHAQGFDIFVEVKPITEFDQAVAAKMETAFMGAGDEFEGNLLLLGTAPLRQGDCVRLGWLGMGSSNLPTGSWQPTPFWWAQNAERPMFAPDFLFVDPSGFGWSGNMTDDNGPGYPCGHNFYADETMRIWAQATNLVQWRAPKS